MIGTALAMTAVALGWGIRKFRRAKKNKEAKVQKYKKLRNNHEKVVQQRMEFMDSQEAVINAEFDRFRNLITNEDREVFDKNYNCLRETMLNTGVDPIKANEIGTMFLASVVLRNNIEARHFSDHTRCMLEGNAELLPGAIRASMEGFDEDLVEEALDFGRTAMDMVITGVSREEYLYANYH